MLVKVELELLLTVFAVAREDEEAVREGSGLNPDESEKCKMAVEDVSGWWNSVASSSPEAIMNNSNLCSISCSMTLVVVDVDDDDVVAALLPAICGIGR